MDSPSSGIVDEAEEKLFGDSNSSGSKIEIKFVTDPKNGDTKIDISEAKQSFVGMGKEELMKFSNNPFWVRMRWFLFILFWALWFGMLVGAVAIILLAPKCSAPVKSKWYKESPIYHLNLKNFKDGSDDGVGDLAGLHSKLEYIKDLGVETILLDPIMKTADDSDDVTDFQSIDPNYGTFDDLKRLVASAKEKGLHLLMKIVPNFSSIKHDWFIKSERGTEPFKDYYVWTDPNVDKNGNLEPLNNWLSVNGGSAWTYSKERKQYYLHQFNSTQPDLNFRNADVLKYFEDVFSFWLGHGFDGLYLDKVEHLVEDKDFAREDVSGTAGKVHDEYDFLTHARTAHLQESWDILSKWAKVFKSHSGVLAVSGVPDDLKGTDITFKPINVHKTVKAEELGKILLNRLPKSPQAWRFSCDDCGERLRTGLQAILLMLPGTAVISSGLELGLPPDSVFQWDASQNHDFTSGIKPWKNFSHGLETRNVLNETQNIASQLRIFQSLIRERHSPAILEGTTDIKHQNSILSFSRRKSNSPGYLVLLNLDEVDQDFDLKQAFGDESIKLTLVSTDHSGSGAENELSTDKQQILKVPWGSFLIYKLVTNSQ